MKAEVRVSARLGVPPHDRMHITYSNFIYGSLYIHSVQQTFSFFSLPRFFKHIQKYLKAPPSPVFTGSLSNPSCP